MKTITFNELKDYVLEFPAHEDIKLNESFFHPDSLQKFKSVFADNDGQNANYRIPLRDGKSIHIKKYDGYYKVHWDKANLATDPLGHLLKDAPHYIPIVVAGILFVLIVVCLAIKKNKE